MDEYAPFSIRHIPDRSNAHDIEICLGDECCYTSPIHQRSVPLQYHITFRDMDYDKWERVDQSENKHGPTGPAVKDLWADLLKTGLIGSNGNSPATSHEKFQLQGSPSWPLS